MFTLEEISNLENKTDRPVSNILMDSLNADLGDASDDSMIMEEDIVLSRLEQAQHDYEGLLMKAGKLVLDSEESSTQDETLEVVHRNPYNSKGNKTKTEYDKRLSLIQTILVMIHSQSTNYDRRFGEYECNN